VFSFVFVYMFVCFSPFLVLTAQFVIGLLSKQANKKIIKLNYYYYYYGMLLRCYSLDRLNRKIPKI
jgi:hypothetical protein